jgi:hypothetical protein
MQTKKMMLFRGGGQASWAKMTSPEGKLKALSCHPAKKVTKAEQLTYFSTNTLAYFVSSSVKKKRMFF